MEKKSEPSSSEINLRNKEIRILVVGHFDFIHAGHCQLIQEAKSLFKKVHLIIGIIDDPASNSVLALHEKIDTFKTIPEIDEISILKALPALEDFNGLNIDFLVTANPNLYEISNKVIILEKKSHINTGKLIAKVVRDYDCHVDNLLQAGYDHSSLNVSKASEISIVCKRKLKKIKSKLWRNQMSLGRFESSLDSARISLQRKFVQWSDAHETLLKNWLKRVKASTSVLFKLLNEIWEAA